MTRIRSLTGAVTRERSRSIAGLVRIVVFVAGLVAGLVAGPGSGLGDGPLGGGVAHAQENLPGATEAKERALRAYKAGLDFYKREDWEKAIQQFEEGYKASPQAVFLFNIARAQSKAGELVKALASYRRYLNEAPTAQNRGEVEGKIAAIERQLGPGAALPELVLPEGAADGAEPPPLMAVDPGAARRKPKVLPIVLGVVGGAVVLGTVLGIGIYFGTHKEPKVTVFEPVTP